MKKLNTYIFSFALCLVIFILIIPLYNLSSAEAPTVSNDDAPITAGKIQDALDSGSTPEQAAQIGIDYLNSPA